VPEYLISVRVTSDSDDRGLQAATDSLKKVGEAAERTEKKVRDSSQKMADGHKAHREESDRLSKALSEGLGGAIANVAVKYLGLLEIITRVYEFFKESIKMSIENEASNIRLAESLRVFTGANKGAIESISGTIERLAALNGYSEDAAKEGFTKFLAVTKDSDQALKLLQLAMGGARKSGIDLDKAIQDWVQTLRGRAVMDTSAFGTVLRELTKDGKLTTEEMQKLDMMYGNLSTTTTSTSLRQAELKEKIAQTRQEIGSQFMPSLNSWLELFLRFGERASTFVLDTITFIKILVQGATDLLVTHVTATWHLVSFQWGKVKEDLTIGQEVAKDHFIETLDEAAAYRKKLKDIWGTEPLTIPTTKPPEIPDRDKGDKALEQEQTAVAALANSYRDLARQEFDQAAAKVREAETGREAFEAFEEASKRRMILAKFEQDALFTQYQKDLAAAKNNVAAKEAIYKKYLVDKERLEKACNADIQKLQETLNTHYLNDQKKLEADLEKLREKREKEVAKAEQEAQRNRERADALFGRRELSQRAKELKDYRRNLRDELEMEEVTAARKKEIAEQLAQVDLEIAKEEAAAKRALTADVMSDLLMSASQAFGNNKALAIASTILSTYSAAQKAYEAMVGIPYIGPALAVAAAAAAVLSGLARVKQIQSQEMKSAAGGFDVPEGESPLTRLHPREMVLPEKYADVLRDLARDRQIINSHKTTHNNRSWNVAINTLDGGTGRIAERNVAKRLYGGERLYEGTVLKGSKRK